MQTARVQWVGKERFVAQAPSGHMVALDSDRSTNGAPGPMELLLVALGACTATDVVSILAKKRQKLDSLEVEVSGERAAEPPTVWVKLEIVYKLRGESRRKSRGTCHPIERGKILLGGGNAPKDRADYIPLRNRAA